MPKDKAKIESLSGRFDILALEGRKTSGLSNQSSITLKGLQEYSISIQPGIDFYLYKSNCAETSRHKKQLEPCDRTSNEQSNIDSCFIKKPQTKRIHFENRQLIRHNFSGSALETATFRGCNLSGADFRHADLKRCIFDSCTLEGADFRHASLHDARFIDCQLLAANFDHSLLNRTIIENCAMGAQSFHNAHCLGMKLHNSDISHGFFDGADLSGAELQNVKFRECTLSNTHFTNALLSNCEFRSCDSFQYGPVFSNGLLNNVAMIDCEFQDSKLAGTTISNSIIIRVALESALMEGTHFSNVIFQEGELKECYSLEQGPLFEQCRFDHILINQVELIDARFNRSAFTGTSIRDSDFDSWTMALTSLDSDTSIE